MLFNYISALLIAPVAAIDALKVTRADNASAPTLPDRQPFGFGSDVTGGGTPTSENTFVVDNMMDLRAALKLTTPRTIYVKGELDGNQINETTTGDCQFYIDSSNVKGYNFTLYLMAMNETYMDAVETAATAGELFENQNATEYLALLKRQNVITSPAQSTSMAPTLCMLQNTKPCTGMARSRTKRTKVLAVHRHQGRSHIDRLGRRYVLERRGSRLQLPKQHRHPQPPHLPPKRLLPLTRNVSRQLERSI